MTRIHSARRVARRRFNVGLLGLATACATACRPGLAHGEDWPNKPVRIIEYFPAGVARDGVTRVIADRLSTLLGQKFVVDNRPGASGKIALTAAARAAPDGYTLAMIGPTEIITRFLMDLPYDLERDFAPVTMVDILPVAAVTSERLSIKSVDELVQAAKSRPGELKYGSPGVGSFQHMNAVLFENLTGTRLQHIPYGQGKMVGDMLGGHIDLMFDALPPWIEHARNARVRMLAITGRNRAAALPSVPTFAEAGLPAYDTYAFYGIVAPAGTPSAILNRLQQAVEQMIAEPALRQLWLNMGGQPTGNSPTDFAERIRFESQRWGRIIGENRIRIDGP